MKKKVNLYFNRWFSVSYLYMNHLRGNPDGVEFKIFGTHPDPMHMSLQGCDYAEIEPVLQGVEYVQYLVDFCRKHEIDVFIPRLKMLDIAKHVHLFDAIGTKVLVCRDTVLLESLVEKDRFYKSLAGKGIMEIPAYEIVNNADDFKAAYERLVAAGHRVCFKPNNSEGGLGFRIIDNERDRLQELFGYVTQLTSFEDAYRTLSSVETFDDLMVMELLPGHEYSIDCLADENGRLLAAVPRRKESGRLRVLDNNAELIEIAHRVADTFHIPFNFNIQMKYNGDTPKLLEINPRMSGGLHVTCLSGVNFPYLAVKSALGGEVGPITPEFGIWASHIEQPMRMHDWSK
ncbi:ATP-grasp domain-containing protein [Paenibacillus sp. YIM B09110]|uniref:ATP-grasp domain-containing protein n=1 Tax=Paenibacillus sp. YIM B09110 TaxID=3126102 RepID=UPI00301C1654